MSNWILGRFEKDFIITYGDKINLDLLSQQEKSMVLKNTFNYFKNAMIAIEKYFDFKTYKLFELLEIENCHSVSSITWIETYSRFKKAIGEYSF